MEQLPTLIAFWSQHGFPELKRTKTSDGLPRNLVERPRKTIKIPTNSAGHGGLIALWGEISLVPLGSQDISLLAAGNQINAGLLLDISEIFNVLLSWDCLSTSWLVVPDLLGQRTGIKAARALYGF